MRLRNLPDEVFPVVWAPCVLAETWSGIRPWARNIYIIRYSMTEHQNACPTRNPQDYVCARRVPLFIFYPNFVCYVARACLDVYVHDELSLSRILLYEIRQTNTTASIWHQMVEWGQTNQPGTHQTRSVRGTGRYAQNLHISIIVNKTYTWYLFRLL